MSWKNNSLHSASVQMMKCQLLQNVISVLITQLNAPLSIGKRTNSPNSIIDSQLMGLARYSKKVYINYALSFKLALY